LIVTTDGAQGGAHTSIPRGPELARVRADETRCAAEALGIQPPILLDFPDAKLGDYTDDPTRLFRLTQEIYQHLQPLSPDALISWGPDGATGHPDHRLTSDIVTQLVRSGAPGIPQHLFYASLPASGMLAINPGRGVPPYLIPQAKYFTVHVPFTEKDFDAARRAMSCHRTQFTEDVVQRVVDAARSEWKGALPLVPFVATDAGTVLLR
jgi:LmbE family N-acetylglucosaminyl deacetylase